MKFNIAIIAALPGELQPLVRGWKHERRGSVHLWSGSVGEYEVTAACAGAGRECATRAFAAAESLGTIDQTISWGWVGALDETFEPGKAYGCSEVVDLKTGERFCCAEAPANSKENQNMLVTSPRVAGVAEKLRLAAAYGPGLVDMEAAAVARLAVMRGIPFLCIKGVSDGFRDHLPDFNRFMGADGQMQMGKLIVYALFHPGCWPSLMRMGENSRRAAVAMAVRVRALWTMAESRENDSF